jgi:hypothetical protein
MTGLALYDRDRHLFSALEAPFIQAGNHIESVCRTWNGNAWVGWEHYNIRPKSPPTDAHYAIEMIGVCRRVATLHRSVILPRAEQEQRKVATREMLEHLGWWVPGKDDAQSAAQHLLAWMMRSGNLPDDVAVKLAQLRQR